MKTLIAGLALAAALSLSGAAAAQQPFGSTGPGVGGQCSTLPADSSVKGRTFTGSATWSSGETKTWTITFNPDCTATYSYNGKTYRNAIWSESEITGVIWDTNGGFSFYVGELDGKALLGIMINVRHEIGLFDFSEVD